MAKIGKVSSLLSINGANHTMNIQNFSPQQKPIFMKNITWNGSLLKIYTAGLIAQSNTWWNMTLLFTNWDIYASKNVLFVCHLCYYYPNFVSQEPTILSHTLSYGWHKIVCKCWKNTTQVLTLPQQKAVIRHSIFTTHPFLKLASVF